MKFNCTFVASALSALMLAACSTGPKVVENPLIESSNSMTLDVSKVELTDTATVLHVDAYFSSGHIIGFALILKRIFVQVERNMR